MKANWPCQGEVQLKVDVLGNGNDFSTTLMNMIKSEQQGVGWEDWAKRVRLDNKLCYLREGCKFGCGIPILSNGDCITRLIYDSYCCIHVRPLNRHAVFVFSRIGAKGWLNGKHTESNCIHDDGDHHHGNPTLDCTSKWTLICGAPIWRSHCSDEDWIMNQSYYSNWLRSRPESVILVCLYFWMIARPKKMLLPIGTV